MYYAARRAGNDIAHVIARTAGAHRKYYYRRLQNGAWTPWEEIKLTIEDNPVVPYVLERPAPAVLAADAPQAQQPIPRTWARTCTDPGRPTDHLPTVKLGELQRGGRAGRTEQTKRTGQRRAVLQRVLQRQLAASEDLRRANPAPQHRRRRRL